jgi:hypothetical protein
MDRRSIVYLDVSVNECKTINRSCLSQLTCTTLPVEHDEPYPRTSMFDSDNDHSYRACQERHASNLNEQINRRESNDCLDRFDNEIHLIRACELDLCALMFEMVWQIHRDTRNIDDTIYRTDLCSSNHLRNVNTNAL